MGIYGYPTLGIRTGKRQVPEAIPMPVPGENLYPHPWVLTSQAFGNALGIGDGREEGGMRARVGLSISWPHCHALDLLPRRATLVVGSDAIRLTGDLIRSADVQDTIGVDVGTQDDQWDDSALSLTAASRLCSLCGLAIQAFSRTSHATGHVACHWDLSLGLRGRW
jgi:hypothetical protein